VTLEGDLQIGSGAREDGQGEVINMLIFYCNHCNEMLTGGDYESTDQIVDRLDEHIKKCPRQHLPSREQRALPRRDLTLYDHSMRVSAVRVRYGYTDHHARSSSDLKFATIVPLLKLGAWTFPILTRTR
jgi:hypothetical protein